MINKPEPGRDGMGGRSGPALFVLKRLAVGLSVALFIYVIGAYLLGRGL